jgi:hypothetical protein
MMRSALQVSRRSVVPGRSAQAEGSEVRAENEDQRDNRGENYPKLPGSLGHGAQFLGLGKCPRAEKDESL